MVSACLIQVWLELYRTPSEEDRELIGEVFQSWYMLGRLGGFNGMNMQVRQLLLLLPYSSGVADSYDTPRILQVFYKGGDDTSYMTYDAEECESSLNAFIHEMSDLEAKGRWMRAWYARLPARTMSALEEPCTSLVLNDN